MAMSHKGKVNKYLSVTMMRHVDNHLLMRGKWVEAWWKNERHII